MLKSPNIVVILGITHFKTHRKKYFLKMINLAATGQFVIFKNTGEGLAS